MSNSPLVVYTRLSPNCTKPRNHVIDTITIHCMACNASIERCAEIFAPVKRQASSNYGIGSDGRIGLYCDEANRSWCTSNKANDHRAVTIEIANDGRGPDWHVSDKALASLIDLCTDICRRNNIKQLLWKNDKSLIGHADKQNMTVHRWFASKSCPGPYLLGKHSYIAAEVNKRLNAGAGGGGEPAPAPQFYTVVKGDTLSGIGKKLGVAWRDVADLNGIVSPYTIHVGQQLQITGVVIPKPPEPVYYTVVSGDSWIKIAKKYGYESYKDLVTLNGGIQFALHPGMQLRVK